jgi:hypothetical protein
MKHTILLSKFFFLTFLATFLPQVHFGQSYFQKVYVATYDQEGQDVLAMADGGYLICGYTTNSTLNDADVQVMKIDAFGNQVWKKTYGGAKVDFINRMTATPDGNYLLVGYSQSYGGGDFDVLLLKIDPDGNTLWLKTYGSSGNDQGMDISTTSDGNFIITGCSNSSSTHGALDMYLAKIDPDGGVIWEKWIGGSATEISNCVKQATDGGYIVMGMTMSYGTEGDAYLVKTDGDGNVSWTQTFGGAHYDEGVYVCANTDGTYTFLVRDSSGVNRDIDIRIIKTDASGTAIWNKVYGGDRKDTPKMIQPTKDGGYIGCGNTRSFGLVNPDMWILKFDANGDTTWTHNYGGSNHEHCYTVREQPDGSYIACGKTESYSPDMDVIFLKLNSSGTMGIENQNFASGTGFNVFPNPAVEEVQLELVVNEAASLSITDMSGREVFARANVETGLTRIPLQDHAAGVYFVTVRTRSQVATRKLILNNQAHE